MPAMMRLQHLPQADPRWFTGVDGGMADALDPASDLPRVLTGSIAQRLKPRLPPTLAARCVAPQGDAVAGALLPARESRTP